MVVKVYISGTSPSTEVSSSHESTTAFQLISFQIKSQQQRAQLVLDSAQVRYEAIDITDPGHEEDKEMIKQKCKHRNDRPPRTPQFFNDDTYCGVSRAVDTAHLTP